MVVINQTYISAEKLGTLEEKKIISEDEQRISFIDPSSSIYHEDFSKTLFNLRKNKGLQYAHKNLCWIFLISEL
ncbi:hypothetical protein [Candidatus Walczuchella monophlebidarum]|uniref:hypothetical protein n=1 Tax=Candidatus Walczuchella monophlebidarum TaxID=1415657 RepID=UPI00056E904C|nr:hypothetical protein [Candidatus Walczuchella monophlebidarum]